jgi:prefoldin subunit 5
MMFGIHDRYEEAIYALKDRVSKLEARNKKLGAQTKKLERVAEAARAHRNQVRLLVDWDSEQGHTLDAALA